jgi:hypothetical protein
MASDTGAALWHVDGEILQTVEAESVMQAEVASPPIENAFFSRVLAAREPHPFQPLMKPQLQTHLVDALPTGGEPPVTGGDFNGDGIVSGADFVLVRQHWGADGTELLEGWGGMQPDDHVDQNELDTVLLNWLRIVNPPADPEPLTEAAQAADSASTAPNDLSADLERLATGDLSGELLSSHADADVTSRHAACDAAFATLLVDGCREDSPSQEGTQSVAKIRDAGDRQAIGGASRAKDARAAALAESVRAARQQRNDFAAEASGQTMAAMVVTPAKPAPAYMR